MQELTKVLFSGNWRSFKVFKRNGEVKLQTAKSFVEYKFVSDSELTVKTFQGNNVQLVAQTDKWTVFFKDKRHYLSLGSPKLLYEVVTINHTVMVLGDPVSGEKIFFAKEDCWQDRLQSNHSTLL
jgi:hypothetical protein